MTTLAERYRQGGARVPREGTLRRIGSGFGEEADRIRDRQPGIEEAFMERLGGSTDFGRIRGELEAVGQGVAEDLFRPGGQVEQATRGALSQSVQSGFGPSSGGFDRARMNILGGARDRITSALAQAAPQLASTAVQEDLGRLRQEGNFVMGQAGLANDLSQSEFGAMSTIEQLRLAHEQMRMNQEEMGCGLGDRLGSAVTSGGQGAATGAIIGGGVGSIPAAAVGGGIGFLGGLFGGC